jgi:hypothetical protein
LIASAVVLVSCFFVKSSLAENNIATTAAVEEGKPIEASIQIACNADILGILNSLQKNWGEKLMWHSILMPDDVTQTAIFYNKYSQDYTIVQFMNVRNMKTGEKVPMICVIDAGKADIDWKVLATWQT